MEVKPWQKGAFQPPYQAYNSLVHLAKGTYSNEFYFFSAVEMRYIFLTAASQKITSSDRSQQSRFTHHTGRPLLLWEFAWLRNWVHQLGRTHLRLAKSVPGFLWMFLYSVPHHCTDNSTSTINEYIQGAHLHHPWGYVCSEEQDWVKSAAKENLLQVVQTPNHFIVLEQGIKDKHDSGIIQQSWTVQIT